MRKIKAAIIGSGVVGMELMHKLMQSDVVELAYISEDHPGNRCQKDNEDRNIDIPILNGIKPILEQNDITLVFDSSNTIAHKENAPLLWKAGKRIINMTSSGTGSFIVPAINRDKITELCDINLISGGGQVTIPLLAAISQCSRVIYAESVTTISCATAGPGTRSDINEIIETTSLAMKEVGRAEKCKSILKLTPAHPPLIMENTIHVQVEELNSRAISDSIAAMIDKVQAYIPGYRLIKPLYFHENIVTITVKVEGRGIHIPEYAGNIDLLTSIAKDTGEQIARHLLSK